MIHTTRKQQRWIPQIIKLHGIVTVADIGAGDLNWMSRVLLPKGTQYTAYDLVRRHPAVREFDMLVDEVPQVDLLICLWVLNHMPDEDAGLAYTRLLNSGSTYLMMTHRESYPDWVDEEIIERLSINPLSEIRLIRC